MLPEATLPGGARTSVLGFGCAALLGGRTRKEARYLLDAALDSGIRHFDLARVYGTGDAEAVVGELAAGRRDSLTIASKFGIDPASGGAALALGKGLVRAATRRSRRALAFARRHSGRTVRRGAFSAEQARASLETSLAKLGTSRLDAYLLHDCAAADWERAALREELERLVEEGAIGAFGPASGVAEVAAILKSGSARPRLAQSGIDLLGTGVAAGGGAGTMLVVHGVYRDGLAAVRSLLAAPGVAGEWSAALDLDTGSPEVIGDLMLASALRRNPGGIVLVSASSPERIRRNAACAASSPFAPEQLDTFARLVAGCEREALQ